MSALPAARRDRRDDVGSAGEDAPSGVAREPGATIRDRGARRPEHAAADRPRPVGGIRADAVRFVGAALQRRLARGPRRERVARRWPARLLAFPFSSVFRLAGTGSQHAGRRRGRPTQGHPQGMTPRGHRECSRQPVDRRSVHVVPPLPAASAPGANESHRSNPTRPRRTSPCGPWPPRSAAFGSALPTGRVSGRGVDGVAQLVRCRLDRRESGQQRRALRLRKRR
jgi:hypothetical protein